MAEENPEQLFIIQKLYTVDISFESPNAPGIFSDDWKPEVDIELNSRNQKVAEDTYEVILRVTVTAKQGEKTAFLAEVKQAGIFTIKGFPEDRIAGMLGAYCPETLFPFAREAIADFVNKGGFPQLLIAPVNFNALYSQHVQSQSSDAVQDTAH